MTGDNRLFVLISLFLVGLLVMGLLAIGGVVMVGRINRAQQTARPALTPTLQPIVQAITPTFTPRPVAWAQVAVPVLITCMSHWHGDSGSGPLGAE